MGEKAIDAVTGFVKGIGETISAFIELKILAGQTFCDFFSSKIVYEDYGIIEFVEKEVINLDTDKDIVNDKYLIDILNRCEEFGVYFYKEV